MKNKVLPIFLSYSRLYHPWVYLETCQTFMMDNFYESVIFKKKNKTDKTPLFMMVHFVLTILFVVLYRNNAFSIVVFSTKKL